MADYPYPGRRQRGRPEPPGDHRRHRREHGATFPLTLAAGRYSTFVAPQRRVPEVGDQGAEVGDKGTYVYREDGALVTTSESEGCPGCVLPITWSIEGDTLSLTLKQEAGVTTDAAERFVIDGTWTRVP